MIDLNAMNEWQHRCPETGLVYPWYVKSFLDELATWELRDKVVFEYGAGASTVWWSAKCRQVRAIDSSADWCREVGEKCGLNTWVKWSDLLHYFEDGIFEYDLHYDIVVVDCDPVEWRDRCIKYGIERLKPGGKLIIDNWDQPSVWVPNGATLALLALYKCEIYKQEGHPDWQTAVFTKP